MANLDRVTVRATDDQIKGLVPKLPGNPAPRLLAPRVPTVATNPASRSTPRIA